MNVESRVRQIIAEHCDWLSEQVKVLATNIAALPAQEDDDVKAAERAVELAHQVKGSCGTLGFLDVSEAAADLEAHLKTVVKDPGSDVRRTTALFERLRHAIDSVEPEHSTLYDADFSIFGR